MTSIARQANRRGPRSISCNNIAGQIPELQSSDGETASAPAPPSQLDLQPTSGFMAGGRMHTPWKKRTDRSISFDDLPSRIAEATEEDVNSIATSSSGEIDAIAKPREQWQPDNEAHHCAICRRKFGTLNRRHHCRKCGRVVCHACSKGRMQLVNEDNTEVQKQRVCSVCEANSSGISARRDSMSVDAEDKESSSNSDNDSYWNGVNTSGSANSLGGGGGVVTPGDGVGDISRTNISTSTARSAHVAIGRKGPSPIMHSTPPDDEFFPPPPPLFSPSPPVPVSKPRDSGWGISRSRSWNLLGRLTGGGSEEEASSESGSRGSAGAAEDLKAKARKHAIPPVHTEFVWGGEHVMDCRGLLYYLATAGRTEAYCNPAQRGLGLKVRGSAWREGSHHDVVACTPNVIRNSWSLETAIGSGWPWFCVELPLGLCLQATHYTLRHGCFSGAALRSWQLQVSMDGEHWTVAKEHTNDQSLRARYDVHTFQIKVDCARFFKVVMTGRNDIDGTQLSCNGFELYGRVVSPQQEGILKPSHWFWSQEA